MAGFMAFFLAATEKLNNSQSMPVTWQDNLVNVNFSGLTVIVNEVTSAVLTPAQHWKLHPKRDLGENLPLTNTSHLSSLSVHSSQSHYPQSC